MKFISWNVNGLRACVQKGFIEYFEACLLYTSKYLFVGLTFVVYILGIFYGGIG